MARGPWRRIGWRNLGRNRRRSLIAASMLAVGYFSVVVMWGWAEGLVAEMIGNGTEDLVVAGHKMEAPAHMPQVKRSLGLIYAVNPFGADHQSSEHDPSYEWYPERMAEIGLTEAQRALRDDSECWQAIRDVPVPSTCQDGRF